MAEAKLVDSGENLIVLIPEDDGVFYLGEGGTMGEQRLSCTNPVQTYVDLFHCGGRGEEAAEALLEQNLKRAWKGEVCCESRTAPAGRLQSRARSEQPVAFWLTLGRCWRRLKTVLWLSVAGCRSPVGTSGRTTCRQH